MEREMRREEGGGGGRGNFYVCKLCVYFSEGNGYFSSLMLIQPRLTLVPQL